MPELAPGSFCSLGEMKLWGYQVRPAAAGAGTPTGTVSISDGGAALTTCTLTSGACTYATSTLSVGAHALTAAWDAAAE